MQFRTYKDFPASLLTLKRRFGQYQAAADKVEALLGRIEMYRKGEATDNPFDGLTCTHNGESRIRHCVKYHLSGYARLVTLQTDRFCFLLYTGTHEDVDQWLNRHAGLEFLVDSENRVSTTYQSTGDDSDILVGEAGSYPHELYKRLAENEFDSLVEGVPRRVVKALEDVRAGFSESELKHSLGVLADRQKAAFLFDVFVMLGADKVEQARARLRRENAEVEPIDAIDEARLPNIVNADILRTHASDEAIFRTLLRRFADQASYRDWMLFMHPDQEHIVNEDFEGPAKLVGVSGSGKTCVVVRRAIRLALRYDGERILIVTLNRALAALIDELVSACAPDDVRSRIDVRPFFALCQELVSELDPGRAHVLDEYAHKHAEHVEEIWQEYYRCEVNNDDAQVFRPVHDSLLARGCSPEKYLREELNWLRSAFTSSQRGAYLSTQRKGRKYNIMPHFRQAILDGTERWEHKMHDVGVIDTLGIAQELSSQLAYLPQRYRCILVDEVQDFGNIELEIIHTLMQPGENNLFLTGDAAQAVTTKLRQFSAVGIEIPRSRSRALSRNYRNSEDVLRVAYAVLKENLSEEMIDNEDLDIKDPEASTFTGTAPTLLRAPDLASELRYAFAMARGKLSTQPDAKVCVSVCGYSLEEMRRFGEHLALPVLDGKSKLGDHPIFLSDLAHTKGFEFDMVCIVNCADGVFPDPHLPEEERSREIAMLYVAMTRAKIDLCISHSGEPSRVFERCTDHILSDAWEHFLGPIDALPVHVPAVPEHLEEFRPDVVRRAWRQMTGQEFLFTEYAIGLPLELIDAIRDLTNGPFQRKGKVDIRWRNIGDAVTAVQRSPQSANVWGPERSKQLLALADRLSPRQKAN